MDDWIVITKTIEMTVSVNSWKVIRMLIRMKIRRMIKMLLRSIIRTTIRITIKRNRMPRKTIRVG